MVLFRLLLLLCVATHAVECWNQFYPIDHPDCEVVTVPLCSNMKYNLTRLPNHIGYTDQSAIRLFTEQKELKNLVSTRCSPDLVFFLCTTLVPICVNSNQFAAPPMVRPCRDLCENVYNDCIASMQTLNFKWPTNLNCSDLPYHATGMCIRPRSFFATKPNPKAVAKLKATCGRPRPVRKFLRTKNLSKFNYVFRAKRISSNGDKTRVRLSVQKFFKPPSKNNARTHVNIRNCRNSLKFLLNKKMFLVLGSKENGVLKISELMEWKSTYSREIRQYFRNNRRQGTKG